MVAERLCQNPFLESGKWPVAKTHRQKSIAAVALGGASQQGRKDQIDRPASLHSPAHNAPASARLLRAVPDPQKMQIEIGRPALIGFAPAGGRRFFPARKERTAMSHQKLA